jgi:hypothetical protein
MRTSPYLLAGAFVLGVAVDRGIGCGSDKTSPPAAGSGSAPAVVALFVNDAPVAQLQAAQLASWPRLDTLVPPEARKLGTWERVSLQAARPTPTDIQRPSSLYPDMVPAIFPGDGGAPAFGMFDPVELARRGAPAFREDHLQAVRITMATGGSRGQNDDGGGAAADPTKLVVTVKTPAGTTTLTGDKIVALPREPMPGSPDQRGWRLAALLEAAGVKAYDHLVLADTAGTSLVLDKADLVDAIPFVRLNKQGALRFRVFKKTGTGWSSSGDLRGLISIEAR